MLRRGQHFYKVNRRTLVSLQVENECLQIFMIINNSLPDAKGGAGNLGLAPSQPVRTLEPPLAPQPRLGVGRSTSPGPGDSISSPFSPENLSWSNGTDSYFHTENALNSSVTEPASKLWDFLSFRTVSRYFQPQPTALTPYYLKPHIQHSYSN